MKNAAGKAARVRQRVLAVFLPVTAVLYLSAEALDPRGIDQVATDTATAFKLLPIAAAHSSQLYLSGSLSVLALGGLAVSYAAITLLVTGRGWGSRRLPRCWAAWALSPGPCSTSWTGSASRLPPLRT
jgi:hypothetical protein